MAPDNFDDFLISLFTALCSMCKMHQNITETPQRFTVEMMLFPFESLSKTSNFFSICLEDAFTHELVNLQQSENTTHMNVKSLY